MEKILGIVIPDDIKANIVNFCKQYGSNPAEPYMALFTSDKIEAIKGLDRKMQSFCLSQTPFKTVIGGPNLEHSDTGTLLYLSVMMGPLNAARDKLAKSLHIQGGGFFRAQLVLLKRQDGTGENFDEMLAQAKEVFSKAQEISVTELALYSRESEQDSFRLETAYPFTGR